MISAQAAAAKWAANTAAAAPTWAANLQATTKDIVGLATSAASQAKATANYNAAWTSGRLQAALQRVGNAGIKAAAAEKQANYTTGVTSATTVAKVNAFMSKLLPYIAAGLPGVEAITTPGIAGAKARTAYWIDYMYAGKGSF